MAQAGFPLPLDGGCRCGAIRYRVTGVPAFILGGRMLVPGAQDPEVFIRVIERKVLADAA